MSRALAAFVFALAATAALAAPPLSPRQQQAADFDVMWRALDTKASGNPWRSRAGRAATREEFIAALEGAIAALHDDRISLSESTQRRVPYDTDIGARWDHGQAVVEAVRAFSDADVAELRPGQVVTRVDGVPMERAIAQRLGRSPPTPRAVDWALQRILAGPRRGMQRVEVRDGERLITRDIERREPTASTSPTVLGRRMGDERDIGYLRLRIGAPGNQLVEHFDGALGHVADTRALIVDLRENAGPGSREVTASLLQRFAAASYRGRVAVLVDRWTAGEGEALAAGLKAAANARLIGTPTAGLQGELREVQLPHSGIVMRFPMEKSLPREPLRPDVLVDLAAPSGGPGDPILYQALKWGSDPDSSARPSRQR